MFLFIHIKTLLHSHSISLNIYILVFKFLIFFVPIVLFLSKSIKKALKLILLLKSQILNANSKATLRLILLLKTCLKILIIITALGFHLFVLISF